MRSFRRRGSSAPPGRHVFHHYPPVNRRAIFNGSSGTKLQGLEPTASIDIHRATGVRLDAFFENPIQLGDLPCECPCGLQVR
jgi:hypothetical protein